MKGGAGAGDFRARISSLQWGPSRPTQEPKRQAGWRQVPRNNLRFEFGPSGVESASEEDLEEIGSDHAPGVRILLGGSGQKGGNIMARIMAAISAIASLVLVAGAGTRW